MWTRDEENKAAQQLLGAANVLFGGCEPDAPKARREQLRRLMVVDSAAAQVYSAVRERFLQEYAGSVRAVAAALVPETSSVFADLVSHGNEALVDAVDSWRPRQHVRFFSFAYVVIRLRMLQRLRSAARLGQQLVPHSFVRGGLDPSAWASELRLQGAPQLQEPSFEESLVAAETAQARLEWLTRALRRLSSRQRIVVDLLYRQLRTPEEAAEALGVSHQAISALRARALRTLREAP